LLFATLRGIFPRKYLTILRWRKQVVG
jgi:hypothetical protein